MNNIRKLTDSLFWVGINDRRIALFENVYPVPTGMSYNSYVLLDEKTALFDTVDASFTHDFLENVTAAGGYFFASYLQDAQSKVVQYGFDGKPVRDIELPGISVRNFGSETFL